MSERITFLLLCSAVFVANGSSMQSAKTKRVVTHPIWNAAYPGYSRNSRQITVNTPGTDTSIGDPGHRPALWKPLRKPVSSQDDYTPSGHKADLRHQVDYTSSGLDYVVYDENGNDAGATQKGLKKNSIGRYYEPLSLEEMRAEHELFAADVAAFLGLEEGILLETKVALVKKTLQDLQARNRRFDMRKEEKVILKMDPKEQVFRYKKLLELERLLRVFRYVIGVPVESAMATNPEIYYFQLLINEELAFIQNLVQVWASVVVEKKLVDIVEQEIFDEIKEAEAARSVQEALFVEWLQNFAPEEVDAQQNV